MVHKGRVFSELKARSEVRVPFKQDAVTWALPGASRLVVKGLLWGHPGFDSNVDPQSCGPEHLSKKESKGLSLRLRVPLGEHGLQKQLSRGRVGSQRLKRQSPGLHGSQLDPLHSCCGCFAWCFCRTPHNGRGGVSDSFASS